jgi:hypothetical protein
VARWRSRLAPVGVLVPGAVAVIVVALYPYASMTVVLALPVLRKNYIRQRKAALAPAAPQPVLLNAE